jgi:hypothetical protein
MSPDISDCFLFMGFVVACSGEISKVEHLGSSVARET